MNVLVIKDDKAGHYNQTQGLVEQIKKVCFDVNVEYIDVEIKSKVRRKLLRYLLNYWPDFFEKASSLQYISFFYRQFSLPEARPDLIISTGGNTSNLNAWFAKSYRSKNILNGYLRGLNARLFTNITTIIDLNYPNGIILDVAPSIVTQEKIIRETSDFVKNKFINSETHYYTLLIGGNGSGYKFDDDFYNQLICFVKKVSKDNSIKWLITTSRRTPLEVEKKLKNNLQKCCAYFVAYNENPEKVLLPFLGLGKKVFVTEESSSMISEAITSQKPVYTIGLKKIKSDVNYQAILNKFELNGFIKRIGFDYDDFDDEFLKKNITNLSLQKKIQKIINKK